MNYCVESNSFWRLRFFLHYFFSVEFSNDKKISIWIGAKNHITISHCTLHTLHPHQYLIRSIVWWFFHACRCYWSVRLWCGSIGWTNCTQEIWNLHEEKNGINWTVAVMYNCIKNYIRAYLVNAIFPTVTSIIINICTVFGRFRCVCRATKMFFMFSRTNANIWAISNFAVHCSKCWPTSMPHRDQIDICIVPVLFSYVCLNCSIVCQ